MKWLSSLRSLQTLQLSHCSIASPAGAPAGFLMFENCSQCACRAHTYPECITSPADVLQARQWVCSTAASALAELMCGMHRPTCVMTRDSRHLARQWACSTAVSALAGLWCGILRPTCVVTSDSSQLCLICALLCTHGLVCCMHQSQQAHPLPAAICSAVCPVYPVTPSPCTCMKTTVRSPPDTKACTECCGVKSSSRPAFPRILACLNLVTLCPERGGLTLCCPAGLPILAFHACLNAVTFCRQCCGLMLSCRPARPRTPACVTAAR
jgi:hypothetical protein